MSRDRMVAAAERLMRLGVSQAGTANLLGYSIDVVERQLDYLPFRKSRRPEALIVEAIRHDYSPPSAYFHAENRPIAPHRPEPLDKDPERPARPAHADPRGH